MGAILRLLIVSSGLLWVTAATEAHQLLWLLATGLIAYGVVIPVALHLSGWGTRGQATTITNMQIWLKKSLPLE